MKLNEQMIEAVEKRISLPHGTTLIEMSADVCNRFGLNGIAKARKQKHEKASRLFDEIRGTEKRTPSATEKMEKKQREYKGLIEEANKEFKAARQVKAREFDKPILDYIVAKYGPPRKDRYQEICGFGSLAFKDGHFMRKYNAGVPDPLDDLLRNAELEESNGKKRN